MDENIDKDRKELQKYVDTMCEEVEAYLKTRN